MALRMNHILALVACGSIGHGLRRSSKTTRDNYVKILPCPGLALLANADHLRPDEEGMVDDSSVAGSVMAFGTSPAFAALLASAAAYTKEDVHQETRLSGPGAPKGTKYFNLLTLQDADDCKYGATTKRGYACNANRQFSQHGFSTQLLDPRGGIKRFRFRKVFKEHGVLEHIPEHKGEKVLTFAGLCKLLKNARLTGDLSGENALNRTFGLSSSMSSKYHPSVTELSKALPLSMYQEVWAWASLMIAFAREKNGVRYMPLSDLKTIFFDGQFPKGFQKQSWGLRDVTEMTMKMKGLSNTDELAIASEDILRTLPDADEWTIAAAWGQKLTEWGLFTDKISNVKGA